MDYFAPIREAFVKYLKSQWQNPKTQLEEAMAYSLLAGGKRLRPTLFLGVAALYRDDWQNLLPFAMGIEMIHTYSLIHDDLPAMDNDDFRRGKATNHKVYGEAMAILAGDALLTQAFAAMTSLEGEDPAAVVKAVNLAAVHSGSKGMVYGQTLDIAGENRDLTLEELQEIHGHKTGDLMVLSLECGSILGGAPQSEVEAWSSYGESLGLAFQITDDILDEEGTFEELGKPIHSDAQCHKNTYVTILGIEKAKAAAKEVIEAGNKRISLLSRDTTMFQSLSAGLLGRNV